MALYNGTAGNDTLSGSPEDDLFYGYAGQDRIITGNGKDFVEGGPDSDQINGYFVDPTTGRYSYWASTGSKEIHGGDGDDFIYGSSDSDFLSGDAGNDYVVGAGGEDTLRGGSGNDSLYGGAGNESIEGDAGADTIDGAGGADYLSGGDGDDLILSQGSGAATLWGGNGNDTLNAYTGTENKLLDGALGEDRLDGGSGNDTLIGGGGNDSLSGSNGSDSLSGGDGNDSLIGGEGNDSMTADAGDDTLSAGAGLDALYGGDGNDTFYSRTTDMAASFNDGGNVMDGGAGDDSLYGGNDSDTLTGGEGQDFLSGSHGSDSLGGGGGNDSLTGGDGNDSMAGGDGDDTLSAGAGLDSLYGGNGNDTFYSRTTDMAASFNDGGNVMDGGAGDDSLYGGNDSDTLSGGDGQDSINGGDGNDSLNGGTGDDLLIGGPGNDTLVGSTGRDTLEGGDGHDSYLIDNPWQFIRDTQGIDSAVVSASFTKIPSSIEQVLYAQGAIPLPYWIDALLPDDAAGLNFLNLLGDSKTFYFAFPNTKPAYNTDAKDALGWAPFSLTQQERAVQALAYVASMADLTFVRTSEPEARNTIAFATNNQTESSGYARRPSSSPLGSDVLLDNSDSETNVALADGSYGALTLIHEIGHALGLAHPFASEDIDGTVNDPPHLSAAEDLTRWTVMSYTDSPEQYALRYSALDIAALHYLYGPSRSSRTGNDTYTVSSTEPSFIWDGGGTDTLSAESCTQGCTIFLTPGLWGFTGSARASLITAPGQITVNFGTLIENLVGSPYADVLNGNDLSNRIEGGKGDDSLNGGLGNDTLNGDLGHDTLVGGAGADTFVLSNGDLVADFMATEGDQLDFSNLAHAESITLSTTAPALTLPPSVNGKGFVATVISSTMATLVVDAVAPSVSKISASNGAARVQPDGNISVLFSEAIALGTGVIEIRRGSDPGALVESFTTSDSQRVSVAGSTLTLDPGDDLLGATDYFVTLSSGSVRDLAGNFHAGSSDLKIGVNSPATGTVAIKGMVSEGQVLTVSHTLTDADGIPTSGPGAIEYQWKADGIAIAGATTSSYTLTSSEMGKTLTVVASYTDLLGTAESITSIPMATVSPTHTLRTTTVHWKGLVTGTAKALADVSFVKGLQTIKSSSAGQAVFEASAEALVRVSVGKTIGDAEKPAAASAINLTDAIAILKMIVGLPINASGTALSPYQVVAADFNRDGGVSLTDAIDVLKSIVGLTAPAPSWVILDQSRVSTSLSMDSYNADAHKFGIDGWMNANLSIDLGKTPDIQLVGVLAGDVDGSWAT